MYLLVTILSDGFDALARIYGSSTVYVESTCNLHQDWQYFSAGSVQS